MVKEQSSMQVIVRTHSNPMAHATCCAHLLRELRGLAELEKCLWAEKDADLREWAEHP